MSVLYINYFYPSSIPHPYHPSFPTRRSSDLLRAARTAASASERLVTSSLTTSRSSDSATALATTSGSRPVPTTRSEEHTSELQSLRHLVCRLLLEKKK